MKLRQNAQHGIALTNRIVQESLLQLFFSGMAFVQDSTLGLMKEVQMGSIRRVRTMLAAGANVNGSPQLRPLLWAASAGDITMVKFLIENGADVNASAQNAIKHTTAHLVLHGERALHLAVGCDHIHVVRELLKAGADPNTASQGGGTPLLLACSSVRKGRWVEMVRELLDAGANPALADSGGRNLLHFTLSTGQADLAKMLISKVPKSLLSIEDREGQTPLYLAAKNDDARTVSLLLSAGAKQPRCEHRRCCPLIVSISQCCEDVVRLLTTEGGMEAVGGLSTALSPGLRCAVNFGHRRIIRLLLTAGGKDKERFWVRHVADRSTLLHFAAAYGNVNSVRLLLSAGANVAAMDWQGLLPRDVIGDAADFKDSSTLAREALYVHAAVRRELERGPAFSARSWAWPVQGVMNTAAGHGGGGGGVGKPPATSAARRAAVVGVRVLRQRRSNNFFVELIGR